nr:hypothetical protein [Tanacetum cinerariifolium]
MGTPIDFSAFVMNHLKIDNLTRDFKEIVVRRDDNVLYKFKEGDFPRLNLCDIKDMLLLLVQKKLSNLDIDD